ncbi:unnamed protein product [Phytophthora fragariaefolia]|uniref:Unnamed protein product n=1 Tax=Phytophthora fragariaefolia TaxID=1490495 RepID=A0A9W7CU10_9STRA|nr:unnamed protein product [Phytophthora fragariaefolia]
MRVGFFLAVAVATFASITGAENIVHGGDIVVPEAGGQFVGHNNHLRRLKGTHQLASNKEWWLLDNNNEERGFPGMSFFTKLKGKTQSLPKLKNGAAKIEKLDKEQVKGVTEATAKAVKKNRKIWPRVKTFLKILYGATLAALIIVGVEAMLD